MYSPQRLYREDYCKGVESFINFALSNPKNISGGRIRCTCVKCKNKKFHQSDIMIMHLLKKGSLRNIYVDLHTENLLFHMRPC
jgi:hypothetical protein